MNLPNCFLCKKPVVELDGQFQFFDSYLIDEKSDPVFEEKAMGSCHASCLKTSKWGLYWHKKKVTHRLGTLRQNPIKLNNQTMMFKGHNRNDYSIFLNTGQSFEIRQEDLKKIRKTKTGLTIPRVEEFNLELDSLDHVELIRKNLKENKEFPMFKFYEMLNISDKIIYPEYLKSAKFVYDRALKNYWMGLWVSALVEYNLFIPAETGLQEVYKTL